MKYYHIIKPIPLTVLIAITSTYIFYFKTPTLFAVLILLGLVLGLAGDVFLLHKSKMLYFGIAAFMFGHVLYTSAFIIATDISSLSIISLIPVIPAIFFLYILSSRLNNAGKKAHSAIIIYFIAIIFMTISAFTFDIQHSRIPFYSIASVLFCLSDSLLAWIYFVDKTRFRNATVMSIYVISQTIIAFKTIDIVRTGIF